MNTIRSLLTAGRDLFAGVTTPRNGKHPTNLLIPRNSSFPPPPNPHPDLPLPSPLSTTPQTLQPTNPNPDILLAATGPLSHSAITTTIHLTPTSQHQPPSAVPSRKRKAASEPTDPLVTANLTIKRLRRTVLTFQHQERAFAQTSRLKDAALREARRERAEFEARRRWWEGREEELEEKLLLEKVDNEIFAGVEFERGYGVGREEGVKEGREEGRREGKEEGRKEGFKEAQRMFLGGFEDEVGEEGSLAEEDGYAGGMEEAGYDEEAEAPQEEEEEDMGAEAGPTATVRPRVAARALVLDEDYNDEEGEEAEEETYEGVIKIPSDDEIIIFWD